MNYVTGHIPLKCAIQRGWTPAELLFLRGKIGTYHEASDKVLFVDCNGKEFYVPCDECQRIPDIGEEVNGRLVTNVCNVDDESVFDGRPVYVCYMFEKRMLCDELKKFWNDFLTGARP